MIRKTAVCRHREASEQNEASFPKTDHAPGEIYEQGGENSAYQELGELSKPTVYENSKLSNNWISYSLNILEIVNLFLSIVSYNHSVHGIWKLYPFDQNYIIYMCERLNGRNKEKDDYLIVNF